MSTETVNPVNKAAPNYLGTIRRQMITTKELTSVIHANIALAIAMLRERLKPHHTEKDSWGRQSVFFYAGDLITVSAYVSKHTPNMLNIKLTKTNVCDDGKSTPSYHCHSTAAFRLVGR